MRQQNVILIENLKNGNDLSRSQAAKNLAAIKDKDVAEEILQVLIDHLRNPNNKIHEINDQCYFCDDLTQLIRNMGELVLPSIAFLLKDETNLFIRKRAIMLLGEIGSPNSILTLTQMIEELYVEVRKLSAYALGRIKTREALSPLIKALADKDSGVRLNVLEALAELGGPSITKFINNALDDEDENVRNTAIEILGVIGDEQVLPSLLNIYTNDKGKNWLGKELRKTSIEATDLITKRLNKSIVLGELKYSDLRKILALKGFYSSK